MLCQRDESRDLNICAMFKGGNTMDEIASKYGLSRQRVHQIIKRNDLNHKDGGCHIKAVSARAQKKEERDKRYKKRYGCDYKTFTQINSKKDDIGKTPYSRYKMQENNSRHRGIEWKFDFFSWWSVWQASGKWDKRGRNLGEYVMGRKEDKGPYSIENIEITTCSDNISSGYYYMKKGQAL